MNLSDTAVGALITAFGLAALKLAEVLYKLVSKKRTDDATVTVKLADVVEHTIGRNTERIVLLEKRLDDQGITIQALNEALSISRRENGELVLRLNDITSLNANLVKENHKLQEMYLESQATNKRYMQQIQGLSEAKADEEARAKGETQ